MIAAALAVSIGIAVLLVFAASRRPSRRDSGASDPGYFGDGYSSARTEASECMVSADASGDSGDCDGGGGGGE